MDQSGKCSLLVDSPARQSAIRAWRLSNESFDHRGFDRMKWPLLPLSLLAFQAEAVTIYLCKAYSGSTFWSSAHCQKHGAPTDRMVSVPDTLPWEQQVQLAEQERAQRSALANPPAPAQQQVTVTQSSGSSRQAEYVSLNARIAQLDAMAQQPVAKIGHLPSRRISSAQGLSLENRTAMLVKSTAYRTAPAPLLAQRTVTYCTENE